MTPRKEIETLRKAAASGAIDPAREYRVDLGNGKTVSYMGAELIETAEAFVAFADAMKSGNRKAQIAAWKRIENLP
jgi:hypothetical protein